jgi:hypothetical protein
MRNSSTGIYTNQTLQVGACGVTFLRVLDPDDF